MSETKEVTSAKKKTNPVLKAIFWVVAALVALVALIVVLVLLLPLWIGPVATTVANRVVPGITKTDFKLGKFALNPYTGNLEIGALDLSNPTNYSEKTAVNLGSLKVGVEPSSVLGKTIHVKEVTLDGLYVYLSGLTAGNFQDIAKNAAGDAPAEEKPAAEPEPQEKAEPQEKGEGKKVWIERLTLKGIKLKIGVMPEIPVPTIPLTDIGKPKTPEDEGGVTMKELWATVSGKVLESANALGDGAKVLGALVGDGVGKAAEGLKNAGAAATDGLKNAGAAATDGLKNAGTAATDGLKNVGTAATDGLKDAGAATTEGLKDAGKAATEGLKNAGEGIKNLFK